MYMENEKGKRAKRVSIILSSLNKSIQKHNNLMGCQPYAKHRFRQKSERCFCISSGHRDMLPIRQTAKQ